MKKYLLCLLLGQCILSTLTAQSNTPWNNKKAAVVLTYDDAVNQHLDNAIPVLDSLGLKATFYITGYSSSIRERMNDWKKIAINGHELGNHTLYHPCVGGTGIALSKCWLTASSYVSTTAAFLLFQGVLFCALSVESIPWLNKRNNKYFIMKWYLC